MNQEVFKKFNERLSNRLNHFGLSEIREDSIRYDFFLALAEVENLESWDIQLEWPINSNSYVARDNADSKRKEKPLLDLVVDIGKLKIDIEFGLFRQNSNNKGSINKTNRAVKMMNDMIRLCLDSYYAKRDALFICVADHKMIGHQLRTEIIGPFPSDYQITKSKIKKQQKTKTSNFDPRFLEVFFNKNFEVDAKIIYNEILSAKKVTNETRIIVWRVKNKS